ncbi:MAG: hypothetical protein HY695_34485 [Deltaproteobacteria bacterium]|nr:hypothetical protein [Deltaproteobacteria bacterium]
MGLSKAVSMILLALAVFSHLQRHVYAKEPLTDGEFEAVNPAGLTIESRGEVISLPETVLGALVIDNVFGENQVSTRLLVELGLLGEVPVLQQNHIIQSKDGTKDQQSDGKGENPEWEIALRKEIQKDLSTMVINNIFGANQVETVINVHFGVPGQRAGLPGTTGTYGNNNIGDPAAPTAAAGATSSAAPALNTGLPSSDPIGQPGSAGSLGGQITGSNLPRSQMLQNGILALEAALPQDPSLQSDLTELRKIESFMNRPASSAPVNKPIKTR